MKNPMFKGRNEVMCDSMNIALSEVVDQVFCQSIDTAQSVCTGCKY